MDILKQLMDFFDVIYYSQIVDAETKESVGVAVKFKSPNSFEEIVNLVTETDCSLVKLKKEKDIWFLIIDYPFIQKQKPVKEPKKKIVYPPKKK